MTAANVPKLKKIREFKVDEKIDVSPLVVAGKLYVFTMKSTAYVFDVNTGAQLAKRQLAAPFDPCLNPGQMDMWCVYRNWGITATPVIDVATNTIYVTTFGKPNANSQSTERNNMLWILDANNLADKEPPVLIAGNADNGGGGIANVGRPDKSVTTHEFGHAFSRLLGVLGAALLPTLPQWIEGLLSQSSSNDEMAMFLRLLLPGQPRPL